MQHLAADALVSSFGLSLLVPFGVDGGGSSDAVTQHLQEDGRIWVDGRDGTQHYSAPESAVTVRREERRGLFPLFATQAPATKYNWDEGGA